VAKATPPPGEAGPAPPLGIAQLRRVNRANLIRGRERAASGAEREEQRIAQEVSARLIQIAAGRDRARLR
jgi:hypothetical protein